MKIVNTLNKVCKGDKERKKEKVRKQKYIYKYTYKYTNIYHTDLSQ